MIEVGDSERPLVPAFFLTGFADAQGRLMAERRDRTRRQLSSPASAAAALGTYTVPARAPAAAALGRLLDAAEADAAAAVGRIVAGEFPPAPPDRRCLALVLAVQVLLGRAHRAEAARVAALLEQLIVSRFEEAEEDEDEAAADDVVPAPDETAPAEPRDATPSRLDVIVPGPRPQRRSLMPTLDLARQLARRTWQLVRFPVPILLTSDTPAVLWAPSATATPYRHGLGGAEEVRVPLDSRHALIVARRAPAGEIVRDLGERHARALNRTVAEAATEWMYYDPASDPLEGVALRPVEVD